MDNLDHPVLSVARKDVATLRQDFTVEQALESIRQQGIGDAIYYFYVVDSEERLAGVLPTRRLLTATPGQMVSEIMVTRVVSLPDTATVMDACELFVMHKFLAFPVLDASRRIAGMVDISLLSEEAFDLADREQTDAQFEAIGFRVSQVRDASPLRAFRFRFPWLLATIASGTVCAFLASGYEVTLSKSIVLAFFLTLVLGLGESVSIQSMTVTIQALRGTRPTLSWYWNALRREIGTAGLLGTASGCLVGLIVLLWRGEGLTAFSIGSSILLALCAACLFGLSVPALLHAMRLDPKIAAGPLTLACTDICTLLFYFSGAALLL